MAHSVLPLGSESMLSSERPVLVASWHERARRLGLREEQRADFAGATRAELTRVAEQQRALCTHGVPVMEMLHAQIVNTHSMAILTDASGLILHALGDADFLEKADRVALRPGVLWSEASKGTNAIGTGLADNRPTLVHGGEHFLQVNRFLTCSCSPIHDPQGHVIGALDVSGSHQSYSAHTMALVRMSTQMIENHLFVEHFNQAMRIHFHTRPEFIGTLVEGIAAFDEEGRLLAVNASGQFQLGLTAVPAAGTLGELFRTGVSGLIDQSRRALGGLVTLCMHNGVKVAARAEFAAVAAARRPVEGSRPGAKAASARTRASPVLEELNTGDPAVVAVLEKLRRVPGNEIPILILGETGTGKELLARAIHNESPRHDKPFVAVDCASIPECLIESELFGYEDGAFTGARRKGSQGKILQANGGTLFLDEIGDMPVGLQTRLLRALQERTVTPLGSCKSVPVDIAVICATHRNLRQMIERGEFREDLYYRLNGFAVRLPALRDRADLPVLVERILAGSCQGSRPVSTQTLALLRRHRWPGNIRQLSNVLRMANVMASSEGMICPHHLPEDFLEDLIGNEPIRSAAEPARPEPLVVGPACAESPPGSLKDLRRSAISAMLERCSGNVSQAARALGVSRNTIYRILQASDAH